MNKVTPDLAQQKDQTQEQEPVAKPKREPTQKQKDQFAIAQQMRRENIEARKQAKEITNNQIKETTKEIVKINNSKTKACC